MDYRGDFGGQGIAETYSPRQVEAVLRNIGVEVESETGNDFLCFCPFHNNRHSPSFSVSRGSGRYICFNHGCGETGTFVGLVKSVANMNEFEARRLILKAKSEDTTSFEERLAEAFAKPEPFVPFSQDVINNMKEAFWAYPEAVTYMVEQRGFEEDTLEHFEVGYSSRQDMLAVPMHDESGMPIGVVGRPFGPNKTFKNSKGLRKKETLWNAHRAKKGGEIGIITEASFDSMRVHQAGYPNTVATLGGHISKYQFEQLDRFFSTIIIMTDMDRKQYSTPCKPCAKRGHNLCIGHNPGRDLGETIATGLNKKKILWASYERGVVYPDGAKDAGDMTDDQIRQCIHNAVSNYEYSGWGLY
jgi:DNA primase